MKKLITLVCCLAQLFAVKLTKAQIYATSQDALIDTSCIGCLVQNPAYAVDANDTSFSLIDLSDSTRGAGASLNLQFPTVASAGDPVSVVVEDINLSALDSTALKGVFLITSKNGISNGDTMCSCQFSILPDACANRYKLQFNPAFDYDEIQVRMEERTNGAVNEIRIFNAFYISISGTLPIGLSYFSVKQNEDVVDLEWQTATESNNEYFVLEKSTDGVSFSEFAKVHGQGSSSVFHSYSCKDNYPAAGLNYYRIKQTDFGGMSTYFNIAVVNFNAPEKKQCVSPNPCTDGTMHFNIKFPKTTVSIRNMTGECVFTKMYDEPMSYVVTTDEFNAGIEAGIYYVTFDSDQEHFTLKEMMANGIRIH